MPYPLITPRDPLLLDIVKSSMPLSFIAGADDNKILSYVDLVVNDINWWMPITNFNRGDCPIGWVQTIALGCNMFAMLFKQAEASLQDFDYNDNGLTVRVDQVGKINTAHANMLKIYAQQAEFIKKSMVPGMGIGLGTPRYQSTIGQFLKIALGSSFNWGGK